MAPPGAPNTPDSAVVSYGLEHYKCSARQIMTPHLPKKMDNHQEHSQEHNRKDLHNFASRLRLGIIDYVDKWDGKHWSSTVQVGGTERGSGKGANKAAARESAARQALERLRVKYKTN
ncbi:hypothetical protein AX15_003002 [Amanita polypyramis BW_CC]|nr:hypothetical protein AX15_003002 [Amanita polypyramis BW_CC]